MPSGSKPGERRGGRQRGTLNKRTLEELERRRVEEEAKAKALAQSAAERAHIKLGKDVLEDYMAAFHNIAAIYQNRIAVIAGAGSDPKPEDLAAFEKWGSLTAKTAKDLADFQSPKFKAIMVSVPGDQNRQPEPKTIEGNVVEINDPVAVARVYTNMVKAVRKR